jgi:hypothetical protein
MGDLRTAEAVSIVYFVILALVAWVRPAGFGSRLLVSGMAVAVTLGLAGLAASSTAPGAPGAVVRDWMPLGLLLLAYWTPRALVTAPHTGFERWLLRTDARVLGSGPGLALQRAPSWVNEVLELSYLTVYPLVPVSLSILLTAGVTPDVDRFWTTVLLAEFVCYGLLPLFPTRPPRALEAADPGRHRSFARTLNAWVLANASNQWNTFPSGHVAGAVACGLALVPDVPVAGTAVLSLAMLIAVASVWGRYHYAADAAAGVVVALLAFVVARL